MARIRQITGLRTCLLYAASILLTLSSCDIKMEKDICPYNTELVYWYNEENSSSTNQIGGYVNTLTQYLFDENEVLVDISEVSKSSSTNSFVYRKGLPAGNYKLVAWANVEDGSTHIHPQIGVTTKSDLELYYSRLNGSDTHHDNSERLYYARRTFSVGEYGIGHTRVDVLNAHCIVNVKATWTRGAPEASSNFALRMSGIPSKYSFRTEYSTAAGSCDLHNTGNDNYQTSSQHVFHHIPTIHESAGLIKHEVSSSMLSGALTSQFVSYRIKDESHPVLSIHTTDGDSETQVMKDIDLYQLLEDEEALRTTSLRQEYNVTLEIDGVDGSVKAFLVDVEDWEDEELYN